MTLLVHGLMPHFAQPNHVIALRLTELKTKANAQRAKSSRFEHARKPNVPTNTVKMDLDLFAWLTVTTSTNYVLVSANDPYKACFKRPHKNKQTKALNDK